MPSLHCQETEDPGKSCNGEGFKVVASDCETWLVFAESASELELFSIP